MHRHFGSRDPFLFLDRSHLRELRPHRICLAKVWRTVHKCIHGTFSCHRSLPLSVKIQYKYVSTLRRVRKVRMRAPRNHEQTQAQSSFPSSVPPVLRRHEAVAGTHARGWSLRNLLKNSVQHVLQAKLTFLQPLTFLP